MYRPCTAVYGLYTACTRPFTSGHTAVYTVVYTCTWLFTARVRGLCRACTAVYACTWPCTRSSTRVPVEYMCTRPCIRPCTGAVCTCLRPVCTSVQMGRKEGRVHDCVHGRVHRPWPRTSRVHGGVHVHRVHGPYMAVNMTVYTARIRSCTRSCIALHGHAHVFTAVFTAVYARCTRVLLSLPLLFKYLYINIYCLLKINVM